MSKGNVEGQSGMNRRRFLQIIGVAGVAGALYQVGPRLFRGDQVTVRESRVMMGTQINLIVCGPDRQACYDAVDATLGAMESTQAVLSRHDPESELSRLNRFGALRNPSGVLHSVLSLGQEISRSTDGAFDYTVLPLLSLYEADSLPDATQLESVLQLVDYSQVEVKEERIALTRQGMAVTLDGIGKGYVVDQGVAALLEHGFSNVYVEAGGDLMVTGAKPQRKPWRIGVRNPRPEHPEALLTLDVKRPTAIATSGDYMQAFTEDRLHHHILDPRTGRSPLELAGATVTAPSVALADGLATAAMVLGPEQAVQMLESREQCEGLFIGKDLRRYKTSGFPG